MASTLQIGQLVEISGLEGPVDVPEEWQRDAYEGPQELNGQLAQLTQYDEASSKWTLVTFGADMFALEEYFLRPLAAGDVEGFDVFLGPASDQNVLGNEIVGLIANQGHAVCKVFVSQEDLDGMLNTASMCQSSGLFSRLPLELEPGYLGREGSAKTLSLDFGSSDTPDFVRDSQLQIFDRAISAVGSMLRPLAEAELGYDIYSVTNSMLAMPFEGDEEDYVTPDVENQDAADFLAMMWRAKLAVVANVGPSTGILTLLPKQPGDEEQELRLPPASFALFAMDRFKWSFAAGGQALYMTSFLLDAPKEYLIDKVAGDLVQLVGGPTGPSVPKKCEQVAVAAMSERYAFGVDCAWKLWLAYAKAGFDVQTRHPFERWDCDEYYQEDADPTSGYSYTCHGGFSDGIELFDCKFFDISPAEARTMDPTQRQVLEVFYMSLAGAGFEKKRLQTKAANVATFCGLDKNEWSSLPKEIDGGGFGASSGANSITSNRFNYCMNLKGASMTIDTACSSSLVACHTAKLYLLFKHFDPCEAVIGGGVNLSLSPHTYVGCCAATMHSHVGRCLTYNATADGYARGEATAAVALKLQNFDLDLGHYALLAGSQANQDGRSASLTAPNGPAQERCFAAVLREIGISPREMDTTECHGTGTALGDPIEIGAYRKVMSTAPRTDPIVITSGKSNLGHCEGSAGVGGLKKCVLMCMYAEATPNCHLNGLNPHLDMVGFPGVITCEGLPFKGESSYNGVLSFGFGGTNASATCWGVNQVTSRTNASKSIDSVALKKVQDAPAQEVTITGADWEDWDMEGPEKDAKPGDTWEIELDDDGSLIYTRVEKDTPDLGSAYDITGTFNDWKLDPLEPSMEVNGLYTALVEVGPTGSVDFQIVADEDRGMTFFPDVSKCRLKSALVCGPDQAERENCWCIVGTPGERYRVEFYKSDADTLSVSWIRDGPLLAAQASIAVGGGDGQE